jgi:TonB-linked SusC/RagA family outer membrane protein
LVAHGLSPSAAAQNQSARTEDNEYRAPRFLLAPAKPGAPARALDIERTPALARRISVDLDGATLGEAIDIISTQAGFRIGYAADALSSGRRVRLRAQSITVAAALTDVLGGAGVDVVFTSSASVVLVKRVEPQLGSVTGAVTDSASHRPLPGVQIRIEGTALRAVTDDSGRFRISGVPVGDHTLTARRLGYSLGRQRLAVTTDKESLADFVLTVVPTTLEQVVTTVTGAQRRVELGNVIGTINADSVMREAPITSLTSLINARVPGAQVVLDNGIAGSSPRVRIRGLNSFTVSNQPLLVVDGVRVENSTATLGSGYTLGIGYGQTSGRFNDLNPEEIESIEIVKGPSAATLYGTDAANGVIVVRTKRGRSGHAIWNAHAETGWAQQTARFPDNYYSWGRNTVTGAVQQCVLTQMAAGTCRVDSVSTFNPLENSQTRPFGTGKRNKIGLQTSGGADRFTYFVAGEYEGEEGVLRMPDLERARVSAERGGVAIPAEQVRPNALKKVSLRANGGTTIGSKGDVNVSLGLVSSDIRIAGDGVVFAGMLGPGYRNAQDGYLPITSRPGEAFAVRNAESVTHYISSLNANWRPMSWLSTRATTGLDFSSAFLDGLQRRGEGPLGANRLGRRLNMRSNVSQYSVDLGGSASFTPRVGLTSRTSTGVQYNRRLEQLTSARGTGLPPGSETVTGAAVVTGSEQTIESVVAGAYIEEALGFHERLFLTGALRADGATAFGKNFSTATYPKLGLSWLAADQRPGLLTSLRFRAAYGASGVQPASTASLPRFLLGAGIVDGVSVSGARLEAIGNPDLRPERQTEYEAGADLELANRRVRLEATYYNRLSRDALVNRPLPSELGIAFRQENIGSVRNRGFEGLLSVTAVDNPAVTWDISLNGSVNNNKLEKIGAGILFIGPNPSTRNREGFPLFSRFARPILGFSDANGNGIIEENEVQVGDTLVYLGPSLPPKQLTASTSLGLFHGRLHIATQFDYRGGMKINNYAEINRCSTFVSNCIAVNVPTAPLAAQAAAVAFNSALLGRTYYGYIVDASFARWRELSITYVLPEELLSRFKSNRASVTLTGRNLRLFTPYPGVDPETNDAVGLPNVEGYGGNPTTPPVRYWLLRINLGL